MKHFIKPLTREGGNKKNPTIVVYPKYQYDAEDIMFRGGKFYAFYDEKTCLWNSNEIDLFRLIDGELLEYRRSISEQDGFGVWRTKNATEVAVSLLNDSTSRELINYRTWESKMPSSFNFHQLDSKITYEGDQIGLKDYRSKKLKYKPTEGTTEAYTKLMSTLYSEDNLMKIEWAIGSIYAGDSVDIEKMVVLYGKPGTGKSTVLDLIKNLFDGYYTGFIAADLARKSDQFATAVLKDNPLLAIQDDGSLAKIESPIINEIVSHKETLINDKGEKRYFIRPNCMMFLATNELVDIHDTKLGISRRLLDVYPTGNKLPVKQYRTLVSQMKFEYPAIAYHCLQVYLKNGKEYYIDYTPNEMIRKTNIMQNFMFDNYDKFSKLSHVSRNVAYEWFKNYYEESGLGYPPKRIAFGEQLKDYFGTYKDIAYIDGQTQRHVYFGFKKEKVIVVDDVLKPKQEVESWIDLKEQESLFDKEFSDCKAQYASGENDIPTTAWKNVKHNLSSIDTKRVHYVRTQDKHPELVVIDFDIKDSDGKKNFQLNLEEATKWPKTYAELSKGGEGIHLHYFYDGDVQLLSNIFSDNVEIKVFSGNSSLRRRLSKCNDIPISRLSIGTLPVKGESKRMLDWDGIKNEKMLRAMIIKNLAKQYHANTKPSVDYICSLIENAYQKGVKYDVSDMIPDIQAFAAGSTHHAEECLKEIQNLHCTSENQLEPIAYEGDQNSEDDIYFYDIEIFPNLFVVCYKLKDDQNVESMINPSPEQIQDFCRKKLVGFNNKRYDDLILYARIQGYDISQLYQLSQQIITDKKIVMAGARNISYTDIYDFSSEKKSLKKFEIDLGIHHQENHYPWDEPVDESHWNEIVEYCKNDVRATEAVWYNRQEDWEGRKTLAKISGGSVGDSTNSLTTRLIFGSNRHPQDQFVYTDLSKEFPGYKFDKTALGKNRSTYVGKYSGTVYKLGEGGFVWANYGIWRHVKTFDVASMHPHSIIALNLFGDVYTKRFKDLVDARVAVKHRDKETLKTIFNGAFSEFADASSDDLKKLSKALKIAINSIYGLTSASFENPFRDPRNIDNIVAKRGALFIASLKEEVEHRNGKVVHIKTDSIKIENPSKDLYDFVMDYAKKYGYEFEIESEYDRMCLVNDSTYIALTEDKKWSATGAQFSDKTNPYVFKTLFSHDPVAFDDYCITKSTKTALYLDLNEGLVDTSDYEKELDIRKYNRSRIGDQKVRKSIYPGMSDEELKANIENGHKFFFIGKVGRFVPVKKGCGGGLLVIENNDKYGFAAGAKGYRWMESEYVRNNHLENYVDTTYFERLAEDAKETIRKFAEDDYEVEWFISGEPNLLESDELPF